MRINAMVLTGPEHFASVVHVIHGKLSIPRWKFNGISQEDHEGRL